MCKTSDERKPDGECPRCGKFNCPITYLWTRHTKYIDNTLIPYSKIEKKYVCYNCKIKWSEVREDYEE